MKHGNLEMSSHAGPRDVNRQESFHDATTKMNLTPLAADSSPEGSHRGYCEISRRFFRVGLGPEVLPGRLTWFWALNEESTHTCRPKSLVLGWFS